MKNFIIPIYVSILLACPLYVGYTNTGEISLDWSFIELSIKDFEK